MSQQLNLPHATDNAAGHVDVCLSVVLRDLNALQTFVIIALYKSTFTIPYHTVCLLIVGEQVPRVVWQAQLLDPGVRCDVDIACEPVRYRLPVMLACRHHSTRLDVRWISTSELVTVGFTCAIRNKQLQ